MRSFRNQWQKTFSTVNYLRYQVKVAERAYPKLATPMVHFSAPAGAASCAGSPAGEPDPDAGPLLADIVDAPGARQVLGTPPGDNGDDVEPRVQPGEPRVSLEEGLGGADDAAALAGGRRGEFAEVGPRLDLDEGQDAAPPGNEVDLADRRAVAAGDDPIAVQPQPPGAGRLRGEAVAKRPEPIRGGAHAPPFRSRRKASARA